MANKPRVLRNCAVMLFLGVSTVSAQSQSRSRGRLSSPAP